MPGTIGSGQIGGGNLGPLYGDTIVVPPDVTTIIHVREKPPLHVHYDIETPSGRRYRWAHDEPDAANIANSGQWSSTMPGGHEHLGVTLARQPNIDYADLERLSTITARSASGGIVSQARLERTPRTSGDQMAITPAAVGWQANLEDDQSVREVFVDRSVASWGNWPLPDKQQLWGAGYVTETANWATENGALSVALPDDTLSATFAARTWYMAPAGVTIAKVGYRGTEANIPGPYDDPSFTFSPNQTVTGSATVNATLNDTVLYATPATARRYVFTQLGVTASAQTVAPGAHRTFSKLAAYGNHGITTRPLETGEPDGVIASDVVTYTINRWATALTTTSDSVQASGLVIPHLVFTDATTAAEIVRAVTRFQLQDWAVWDNRVFYWHERGARGRAWRTRVAPANLEETGPQLDRLYESVVVQYQDVDGSTQTVGPVGSGADTESSSLKDADPLNPANQVGITRRALLQMGTGVSAVAVEVGRRFLELQKTLDSSGRAKLVGFVEDDRGVVHPYHAVRAGDTLTVVDASNPSPRRIVRAEHSDAERACTVDLDAPPDGLAALLERLQVVLVPLGI
jgi:hypothetical protein